MKKVLSKTMKRMLTLTVVFCMIFAMALPAMAAETGESGIGTTDDPRESIMLMTLGYEDDNGTYLPYKAGTCFLINDEYVLTNKHVVTITEAELQEIREMTGVDDLTFTDSHLKLYLYVNRDMKVAATMHESVNSDDMDFAAVKLAEKIYDRKPIALGDSDSISVKDHVYAMGFPEDSVSTKNYNTKDDVSTVDGTVSKLTVTGSVDVIEHTAPLNNGNSGGPLLDENNNVIGVNTFVADKKSYSIQINYIRKGLDTFGIPYATGDTDTSVIQDDPEDEEDIEDTDDPVVPVEDNTALLTELQSTLEEAKGLDTTGYTEESVADLDDAIGSAETVLANSSAEASVIQKAVDDLNDAMNDLEEKSGPSMMMILIIVIIVVVVVVIIILVVVMSGKKKKTEYAEPRREAHGGNISGNQNNGGNRPVNQNLNNGPSASSGDNPTTFLNEGTGETTLLNAGAGETTLLSGAGSAYLIRKKNGEKIAINAQNFKIGKERRRVNYCVSDNNSVSRVHCEIVKKGPDFYVIDQGATNFTYVNGVQLSPQKETLLSDCSVLKLSDEEFEFHMS